jgi:hypothetical protein
MRNGMQNGEYQFSRRPEQWDSYQEDDNPQEILGWVSSDPKPAPK